jgi:hypothetical protein
MNTNRNAPGLRVREMKNEEERSSSFSLPYPQEVIFLGVCGLRMVFLVKKQLISNGKNEFP